ncbi:putative MFS family arabinose efflux permease [Xanthomonas sp. JAI131]|uniref:MFS transporter n=1 Tax=Xanthomonas sp. JAI131 TaxID=2723067 RepID=UPI0015C7E50F|nr:MFS transporter [Xanthomonas sp. JAI131]NYF22372.1 putative MFS family arabinose efflux permease [Xanthomonas sp. JAI131]
MSPHASQADAAPAGLSSGLIALFAAACGLAVANIYFSQPLIGIIAPELRLHAGLAGLIVALTQLGYGAGLLLLVPLADVAENRRLAILLLGGVVLGLLGIGLSQSATGFLIGSFVVGVCAVATQILVPFASHLAPEASRGRVVGTVMGGLLAGIMLARPFSSFVAASLGWRAVFFLSAGMMLLLMAVLRWRLPQRRPAQRASYAAVLASLPRLYAATPLLRRRAFYQGMMFAAFNVFWTGSPLLLAQSFGMDQRHIALFALAGAAGALVAPLAGRMADRGWTRPATGWALAAAALSFGIGAWAAHAHALLWLVIAALVLDAAVQVCQVLSLRSIYMLAPEQRGRLNGLFMTSVFVCGAAGSLLAAAVFAYAGWPGLSLLGAGFGTAALLFYFSEFRRAVVPAR